MKDITTLEKKWKKKNHFFNIDNGWRKTFKNAEKIMEKCIKIGNVFLIGILFFLFSCEKKYNKRYHVEYFDTIKSGKLGLVLYQTEDTIKINIKSLVKSSKEDYRFLFLKNDLDYKLISQNMFFNFNLSQINVLSKKNIDTILYQENDLYNSQVTIRQEKMDNQIYKLYIEEKPTPEKSLEIIYDNNNLCEVQLIFFRDKYIFDVSSMTPIPLTNSIIKQFKEKDN